MALKNSTSTERNSVTFPTLVAAVVTIWPLLSSAQLILHAKLYRDEYGDLRTLLDY